MKHKRIRWHSCLLFLGVAIAGLALLFFGYRCCLKAIYPLKYTELVAQYAAENQLPESLVYAVIHTESRFDETAVSSAGAKGLMQLTDSTYAWVSGKLEEPIPTAEDVFTPSANIRCGTEVLQILYKQFGHTETVLAAYNAGSGNVSKWLKNPEYSTDGVTLIHIPFSETEKYVIRVLDAQKRYQTLYELQ